MTRNAMAKKIEEKLGMSELEGVRHIDRPTWWLRQMVANVGVGEQCQDETVCCPKVDMPVSLDACHSTKLTEPDVWYPDCVFCEHF